MRSGDPAAMARCDSRHRLAFRSPCRHASFPHAQARPDSPRRIDLEPRKPLHRLDRRRPDADRRRSRRAQAGRLLKRGRLRLRPRLHLGAEARDLDALACARRDGPHLAAGRQRLAPERAPLRRAAGPEQGRDRREVRRRAGAGLAPQLRRAAAAARAGRPAQRAQRPALRRAARRADCRSPNA